MKPAPELARDRRPEQEAARLGADDELDVQLPREPASAGDRGVERLGRQRAGVMSLKTIPGFGKSGMSRIVALARSTRR